jgi:hypothetical protein
MGTVLDGVDRVAGQWLERLVASHHRRRLTRLGWAQALAPTGARLWAGGDFAPRPGNELRVHVDGANALPVIAEALTGARSQVHIANWHASRASG